MSAISLKSITGITSITTPAGVDNQLTLHNNNTTEAVKLDIAGNLHFHNHLNITGVSTASNFKTGTSNLHNTGLNVQDLDVDGHTNLDNVNVSGITTFANNVHAANVFTSYLSSSSALVAPYADIDDYVDVGSNIKLGNAGIITATSFVGDGSNLTGVNANVGITTNLSGSFTASAGSPSTINTFGYGSGDIVVEYRVFIKNGSDFQSQKLLAMRDGTTVHSSQFAVMYSSSLLVQLDATISSGNILLRATPETGVSGSTTYKIKREVM